MNIKYLGLINTHTKHLIGVSNDVEYLHSLASDKGLSEYEIIGGLKAIQQATQWCNIDTSVKSNKYTAKQIKTMYVHWE